MNYKCKTIGTITYHVYSCCYAHRMFGSKRNGGGHPNVWESRHQCFLIWGSLRTCKLAACNLTWWLELVSKCLRHTRWVFHANLFQNKKGGLPILMGCVILLQPRLLLWCVRNHHKKWSFFSRICIPPKQCKGISKQHIAPNTHFHSSCQVSFATCTAPFWPSLVQYWGLASSLEDEGSSMEQYGALSMHTINYF